MKQLIVMLSVLSGFTAKAQISEGITTLEKPNIKVTVVPSQKLAKNSHFFLDNERMHQSLMYTINPEMVEKLGKYDGVFYITLKNGYKPQIITLNDLREKYTSLDRKAVVFQLAGKLIKESAELYVLDEKYIQTIIVDKIEGPSPRKDINVVNIITKRNSKNNNSSIRIRGVAY